MDPHESFYQVPSSSFLYCAIRKSSTLKAPAIFFSSADCDLFLQHQQEDPALERQVFSNLVDATKYIFEAFNEPNPLVAPELKYPMRLGVSTAFSDSVLAPRAGRKRKGETGDESKTKKQRAAGESGAGDDVNDGKKAAGVDNQGSLGFVWIIQGKNDAQWKQRFEQLVLYKAQHGHCNVPQKTELGNWVAKQKDAKVIRDLVDEGKPRLKQHKAMPLSDDRIAKLESIGFQWRIAKPPKPKFEWDDRYKQLVEFKMQHGHCNVPKKYKADPSFGRWVQHERYQRKLKMKGTESSLTDERENMLTELGFRWSIKDVHRVDANDLDIDPNDLKI